jgi:hypothetical protein
MGLTRLSPVPPMIGLGFAYAICGVVLWPSIATSVQQKEKEMNEDQIDEELDGKEKKPVKLIGLAFGVSISALNTALTVVPLISAEIRVRGKSFLPVEIFYASLGSLFLCNF